MCSKYGSTDANETIVENAKEAEVEIDLSRSSRRRQWWRDNQNIVFGLGHIHNDLCAAMWFSYMMLFFQAVLEMRSAVAGFLLMTEDLMIARKKAKQAECMSDVNDDVIGKKRQTKKPVWVDSDTSSSEPEEGALDVFNIGQIVDAIATPIVGILADKYGNKKSWHFTGSIMVTCTFPMLFIRCWGCWIGADVDYLAWWMPLYYTVLITFFQIGWAIVQITHLAMIPSISDSLQVRSELTSIRYMASVTSSITVYLITWVVLRATNYSTFIGPTDDYKLRDVALIVTGIGVTAFTLFHILFKLRSTKASKSNGHTLTNGSSALLTKDQHETEQQIGQPIPKSKIFHFLRMPLLYQTSLLYVFSRLYWALTLVYVPLFLEERLSVNPSAGSELVASVPLVLYISSFFSSLLLKSNISSCGNQVAYIIGSFLSFISCLWIALGVDPHANIAQIYLVAALMGAGSSITLVSSLCVTADLIGPHSHQGAAIYSIVTFADKLVTGIAVVAIENYKCRNAADCPEYYRGVLTYACGGSAVLGSFSLIFTRLTSTRKTDT